MSEYQYSEGQTIDSPLTPDEQKSVSGLSSHITVSAINAWVEYSWGDFKHEPLQVLVDYFDAFVYLSNWGSKQLALRFPADLLDAPSLQPYLIDPDVSLTRHGEWQLLNIEIDDEPGDDEWIEESNLLATLAPLRNDILHGDTRALYLVWMRAFELVAGEADEVESEEDLLCDPGPPIPPGLGQLTASLNALVDLFSIDRVELAAVAQLSRDISAASDGSLGEAIRRLSRAECNHFLLRLAQDEPHLAMILRRRLAKI